MDVINIRSQMPNYEIYRDWRRPDPIESILIHHSGSDTVNYKGLPNMLLRDMAKVHVDEEGRAHVSYHYAINRRGQIFYMLDEQIAGYHAALPLPARSDRAAWRRWQNDWLNGQYFNRRSVSIVLLGWFDTNRRRNGRTLPDNDTTSPSPEQWQALVELAHDISERHNVPIARIEGHREALARAGFGRTTCPGLQLDMAKLRAAVSGQSTQVPGASDNTFAPSPPSSSPLSEVLDGSIIVPGPAPALTFAKNRPLIGLHARNDHFFSNTDWQIIQQARVESLKMMSFTRDEVYAQARQLNPNIEFIVRLYPGSPGRGNMPSPQQFADRFRATIDRLHQKFGVLKFEIHNEPNHPSGLEGWGSTQADALSFQAWYKQTLGILRQRHRWALFGYPGLAIPHNDLLWLDWNREAIEMSDWLGMHSYWQTPPGLENNFTTDFWGFRFKIYHDKYPHKLIEITEFGNSNGQNPPLSLSRYEQRRQYEWWLQQVITYPYIGSAHSFIATSPDPKWEREGFTWGNANGPFEVVSAVGGIGRAARRPDWYYASAAKIPAQLSPDVELSFPVTLGNGGRLPWLKDGDTRSSVMIQWVDGNSRPIGKGRWSRLPHDMAPGDRAEFEMKIQTPSEPASYRLQLTLYHSGLRKWFHQLNPNKAPDYFSTTVVYATRELPAVVTAPELMASYSLLVVTESGVTKGNALVEVEVRNEGSRRWITSGEQRGSIRLGYHWIDAQGTRTEGRGRGQLIHPVEQGESIRIVMALRFPNQPGSYTLQMGMLSELEQWFTEKIEHVVEVNRPRVLYAVEYNAEGLSQISVGTRREFVIQLRNTGGRSWQARGEAPITVVHYWRDEQGHSVQPTLRVLLPRDVPPNDSVTVRVPLLAPGKPGQYQLQIDMAEEGKLFFSQQGNAPLVRQVMVQAAQQTPQWGAQWLLVDVPEQLTIGQSGQINVHVRNVGQEIWSHNQVRVAYRWPNGREGRVQLPVDVLPGDEIALGLPIMASTAGEQMLTLDLWHETVGWLNVAPEAERISVRPLARPVSALSVGGGSTIKPLRAKREAKTNPVNVLVADSAVDVPVASSSSEADRLAYLEIEDPRLEDRADEAISSSTPEPNWLPYLEIEDPRLEDHRADEAISSSSSEADRLPYLEIEDPRLKDSQADEEPSLGRSDPSIAESEADDAYLEPSIAEGAKGDLFAGGHDLPHEMRMQPDDTPAGKAYSDKEKMGTQHAVSEQPDEGFADQAPLSESEGTTPTTHTESPASHGKKSQSSTTANSKEALRAKITATASHHPEHAMLALDNHKITAWSSEEAQQPGMWFLLDLAHPQVVRSLRLLSQPEQFPRGYILEGSQDGQTWEELHRVPENWSDIAVTLPAPRHLRYVRITQTNHNPWQQPWSVRDVHIDVEDEG